jgi:hypothetical protein
MLAAGDSFMTTTTAVGCYPDYVSHWKQRFETERLVGLRAKYRGQSATVRTPAIEARILAKTRQRPPDGSTHRSTRKSGRGAWRQSRVGRARLAARRPATASLRTLHGVGRPDFEQKAADVIGLYLRPPQHALVFTADEKRAIQALDRLDPVVLPLSPGRGERHGFEYYRHGTLSLYAALNTSTGEIIRQTVPRHTSAALVESGGHRRHPTPPSRDPRDCQQSLGP